MEMMNDLINMGIFIHSGLKFICKILNQVKIMSDEIGIIDTTDITKYETISSLEDSIHEFKEKMKELNIYLEIKDNDIIVKNKYQDILLIIDYTKQP